jgi:DNA-binding GntR family transcriptional regulator
VAAQFGSSIMPARDAVLRLLGEGLAVQEGQKTVVVAPLNVGDFLDIMEIRALLEPRALELSVPRLTAADIAEARRILRQAAKTIQPLAFSELHRRLHMTLYRRSGRPRLLEAIERQHMHMVRYLSPLWALEGHLASWIGGEEVLMRHIEKKDAAEAVSFLRRDLDDALIRILRALAT